MANSNYVDCEIDLSNYDQATLKVDGKQYSGKPTLNNQEWQAKLLQAELDRTEYGKLLFDALLPTEGDLRVGYRVALSIASSQGKRLRLRLNIANTTADLHALKWEFLYDPKRQIPISCSADTAFSRYMNLDATAGGVIQGPPKMLIVISNPTNLADYKLAEIDRGRTIQFLETVLQNSPGLNYEFLEEPATLGNIRKHLSRGFHALHLVAHGLLLQNPARASLLLVNEETDKNGQALFVDETLFSQAFDGLRDLRLLTLIVCHSGKQTGTDSFTGLGPKLVERNIPVVVAMRQEISFPAAEQFIEHFYPNLAKSGEVDAAVNEARQQLFFKRHDWGTPILFMRLAEGRLWKARLPIAPLINEDEVKWPVLVDHIGNGNAPSKVIPFLGPGMKRGLLPPDEEIAWSWEQLPFQRGWDLPRIAQFIATTHEPFFPHTKLRETLISDICEREKLQEQSHLRDLSLTKVIERIAPRYFERDKHEPHCLLAKLPLATYFTTNFDNFMIEALRWVCKQPGWKGSDKAPKRIYSHWRQDVENYEKDADEYQNTIGSLTEPLVFHLFGYDQDPESLVLTEDDYLDFIGAIATNQAKVVTTKLRAELSDAALLFLGYNFENLDCRVLYRGLIQQLTNKKKRVRYAVFQVDPSKKNAPKVETLQKFMKDYCEDLKIDIYWGTPRDFVIELYDHWEKKYERQQT